MASSVIIPNHYGLATYRWTYIPSGKQFTVTMGLHDTFGSDDPTAFSVGHYGALTAASAPAAAANMSTAWRFEGVTILFRTSGGALITGSKLVPLTGTATAVANMSPVFTTLVVSKGTAQAGRQYRGRMYVPFFGTVETLVDENGTISSGTVTAFQAQWATYYGFSGLNSCPPYLLHANPISGPPPVPNLITTLTVKPVVGLQRRRRAKGA